MTAPDLIELRRLAESATPGPWRTGKGSHWSREVRHGKPSAASSVAWCGHSEDAAHCDAAYIAAANPAAILALLDRLAAVEAERDEWHVSANSLTEALQGAAERHAAQHATIAELRGLLGEARDAVDLIPEPQAYDLRDRIDAALKEPTSE